MPCAAPRNMKAPEQAGKDMDTDITPRVVALGASLLN